jgi:hypothetical protein
MWLAAGTMPNDLRELAQDLSSDRSWAPHWVIHGTSTATHAIRRKSDAIPGDSHSPCPHEAYKPPTRKKYRSRRFLNEDQQPVIATRYAQRQLETHYLVAETSLPAAG